MMMTAFNKWMTLVEKKPVKFGLESGFTRLEGLHNSWIRMFLFSKNDMTLQAHRGSFKTTCLSIAIALLLVIQPTKKIIFLRKADDDVKEIIQQVGKMLVTYIFQGLSQGL